MTDRAKVFEGIYEAIRGVREECDKFRGELDNSYKEKRDPTSEAQLHIESCPVCRTYRDETPRRHFVPYSEVSEYWKKVPNEN